MKVKEIFKHFGPKTYPDVETFLRIHVIPNDGENRGAIEQLEYNCDQFEKIIVKLLSKLVEQNAFSADDLADILGLFTTLEFEND